MRLAPLLLLTGCIGWGSAALPPPLSDADQRTLADSHFPLVIGVATWRDGVSTDRLVDGLRDTGLFDRVEPLATLHEPPDLIARQVRGVSGTAVIPIWSLLTLGVIPSSVAEEWGYVFDLWSPDAPGELRRVEYTYTGRTTLGWVALIDGFLPGRTVAPFSPYGSSKMHDQLALAVLRALPID